MRAAPFSIQSVDPFTGTGKAGQWKIMLLHVNAEMFGGEILRARAGKVPGFQLYKEPAADYVKQLNSKFIIETVARNGSIFSTAKCIAWHWQGLAAWDDQKNKHKKTMNEPEISKKEINQELERINAGRSGNFLTRALFGLVSICGHSLFAVTLGAVSFVLLALATVLFPFFVPIVYLGGFIGGTDAKTDR